MSAHLFPTKKALHDYLALPGTVAVIEAAPHYRPELIGAVLTVTEGKSAESVATVEQLDGTVTTGWHFATTGKDVALTAHGWHRALGDGTGYTFRVAADREDALALAATFREAHAAAVAAKAARDEAARVEREAAQAEREATERAEWSRVCRVDDCDEVTPFRELRCPMHEAEWQAQWDREDAERVARREFRANRLAAAAKAGVRVVVAFPGDRPDATGRLFEVAGGGFGWLPPRARRRGFALHNWDGTPRALFVVNDATREVLWSVESEDAHVAALAAAEAAPVVEPVAEDLPPVPSVVRSADGSPLFRRPSCDECGSEYTWEDLAAGHECPEDDGDDDAGAAPDPAGDACPGSALADAGASVPPVEAADAGSPAPVTVATVTADLPEALAAYLGRLLHAPKRALAEAWAAHLLHGGPVPAPVAADWSADVERKVRRHARAA